MDKLILFKQPSPVNNAASLLLLAAVASQQRSKSSASQANTVLQVYR
jgi:hypothetical protein